MRTRSVATRTPSDSTSATTDRRSPSPAAVAPTCSKYLRLGLVRNCEEEKWGDVEEEDELQMEGDSEFLNYKNTLGSLKTRQYYKHCTAFFAILGQILAVQIRTICG
ncbi:hypothetical protein C2S51_011374 [Perilla frutescens var. frutescens]|nr:hypothetical protein C2S51_011374 [Perilla frutescens var. frutescens]